MNSSPTSSHDPILGCLLGTGVGDAIGLPAEGMSRERIARRWTDLQHRFWLGTGMFSDDTEHTLMVASAIVLHRDDVEAFQQCFGWKLRWWLLGLPAGVGLSTAKAILRLWLGWPASRSGVFSAGNGAAMRSAIIGVVFREDTGKRRALVEGCARITHTDPRAVEAALLVAEAAAQASMHSPTTSVFEALTPLVVSSEMQSHWASLRHSLDERLSVGDFAQRIGCKHGVSGFAPHTVVVAIYSWLRHRDDFAEAIRAVIWCGGDTDTVAAITGALCGAELGEQAIPKDWLDGINEWPRSIRHIRQLASALEQGHAKPPRICWPVLPLRNLFFLLVVLLHGFRRLLPPY